MQCHSPLLDCNTHGSCRYLTWSTDLTSTRHKYRRKAEVGSPAVSPPPTRNPAQRVFLWLQFCISHDSRPVMKPYYMVVWEVEVLIYQTQAKNGFIETKYSCSLWTEHMTARNLLRLMRKRREELPWICLWLLLCSSFQPVAANQ